MTKNIYDGSDDALSYGQALTVLAQYAPFANEDVKRAVVAAVQDEHGLTPPPPDVLNAPADPRDITLRNQDAEIAALREELTRRDQLSERVRAGQDEINALRGQLAGNNTPEPAKTVAAAPVETDDEEVSPRDAELASATVTR